MVESSRVAVIHSDHEVFISALELQEKIQLTFLSKEDARELVRVCAPMDFGPSGRTYDQSDRYHFGDYDSEDKRHTLSLLPDQILEIRAAGESFAPGDFITWSPIRWFYPRDW